MIDCILNFFIEHWMIIIPCLLGLVEFVLLLIFKKRPQIIDNSLTDFVLNLCFLAEKKFGSGNGELKEKYVLDGCKDKFGAMYIVFKPIIVSTIATILGCQTK